MKTIKCGFGFWRSSSVATFGLVMLAGSALAQDVPLSFVASPEIYKVIAQNDQYRVIRVTWKPGQRDKFHSHPVAASYWLTSCQLRQESPDGTNRVSTPIAGVASLQPPVASHLVENVGTTDCELIMFEPK